MKKALLLSYVFIFLTNFVFAQENKTVILIVSGQGKTQDEAKQSALRNAIEQSFGAFISSHTEVLDDALIKDEIISVSNGNIQKYEIISETELPNGNGYSSILKATVSVSKLTNFCESKGMTIEIKGSLFAFNVIQKELSASNETKVLQELVVMAQNIAPKMFDYSIIAKEPIKNDIGSYSLPVKVSISTNRNWDALYNLVNKTLINLALTEAEINDYNKLNIPIKSIKLLSTKSSLKGNFNFLTDLLRCAEINQKMYDELAWKMRPVWQQNGNILTKIYMSEKGFKPNNYNTQILYFRNNIKSYLLTIQGIIDTQSNKWQIYSINNVLASGQDNSYSKGYIFRYNSESINLLTQDIVSCGNVKNVLGGRYPSEDIVFLNNLTVDATIRLTYINIPLSLDQIKSLSKLEIKSINK